MAEETIELYFPLTKEACLDVLQEEFPDNRNLWKPLSKRYKGSTIDRINGQVSWKWDGGIMGGKITIEASAQPRGGNGTQLIFTIYTAYIGFKNQSIVTDMLNKFIRPYRTKLDTVTVLALNDRSARQEIQRRINEGIMCSKCGKNVPSGTRFCPQDGTPISRVCPKCDSNNTPIADFCTNCGTKL